MSTQQNELSEEDQETLLIHEELMEQYEEAFERLAQ